jgi:AbiV family abortive infection protein
MAPRREVLIELVHSLLENARNLTSDARLLHDHCRYARSYALAALAGEELGKIQLCLGPILGIEELSDKEFRRAWQSHSEKLIGLAAYQVAFIEDLVGFPDPSVRDRPQIVAKRKMDAIYVDLHESGIVTPESVTADEATELLDGVEAAVRHASKALEPMTMEVMVSINAVAPRIISQLDECLARLAPEDGIDVVRDLLRRLPDISAAEWTAAIQSGQVPDLLGLEH